MKGGRRNPPGWRSYHLFTLGGETVLMEEWGTLLGTPSGLALIHHVAMTRLEIGMSGVYPPIHISVESAHPHSLSSAVLHQCLVISPKACLPAPTSEILPLVVTPCANIQKGSRNSFSRGLCFLGGSTLGGGVAGTETLTSGALAVTRGLWKVTPEGEGLGARGPSVQGVLAGGDLCQGH